MVPDTVTVEFIDEGCVIDANLPDIDSVEVTGATPNSIDLSPSQFLDSPNSNACSFEHTVRPINNTNEISETPAQPSNDFNNDSATKTNLRRAVPLIIRSLAKVSIANVVAGDTHLLLLSSSGVLYVFGTGEVGQLGLGDQRLFVRRPEALKFSKRIIGVAAGSRHSLALDDGGSLHWWGDAYAAPDGLAVNRSVPRAVQQHPPFDRPLRLINAAYRQSMVVDDENRLFVWGEAFLSQLFLTPQCYFEFPRDDPVQQLGIGAQFALALTTSGVVYAWGDGTYYELGRLKEVSGGTNGSSFATVLPREVLLFDGAGIALPKVVEIACGARHSLLLTEDGRVYSFGDNSSSQCGFPNATLTRELGAPGGALAFSRKSSAVVLQKPVFKLQLLKITAEESRLPIRSVACGLRHSAAITAQNQILLWGHSSHHKLIHTLSAAVLLEERFGVGPGHLGVSVQSGLKDCCPKPRLVFSLLNKNVACVCLGPEFTVVVTGDGGGYPAMPSEHPPDRRDG